MTYSVYLFRFADGKIREPDFETFDMARLGTFEEVAAALEKVFPGQSWTREDDGWRSSGPPNQDDVSLCGAPDDASQVMCLYMSNPEYGMLGDVATTLGLLIWNPENEKFFDPTTVTYYDA